MKKTNNKTKENKMKEIKLESIEKKSYYIHPDLPNHKIYTDNINKIPSRKNIDKNLYIKVWGTEDKKKNLAMTNEDWKNFNLQDDLEGFVEFCQKTDRDANYASIRAYLVYLKKESTIEI